MGNDADDTCHAGQLIARRLKASGIDTIFTLSGGHLFSIYDGCRSEGIRLIDTRHEQTAAFAAEGWSKVTRQPGVAALTAGPGVTNGMSAMAAAQQNSSPLLVLGGRAPAGRWGMGSLQEIDHVPFVSPLTRFAATAPSAEAVSGLIDDALRATVGAPSGVAFVDFPMDHVFSVAADSGQPGALTTSSARTLPDGDALDRAVSLLGSAQRPVIMAGTNVWWGHAEEALLRLAEQRRIPVLMNGMARGTVPADHPLAFSRARSKALGEADVAVVVGVPMDFRLGFGAVFGQDTKLIVADRVQPEREHPRPIAAGLYGDLSATLTALSETPRAETAGHEEWVADLRATETAGREREQSELADDRSPLHPMRVYAELAPMLDRDAIIVVDAGDFGSYAGRVIDSYVPGAWLDSGPFGCLGLGSGVRAGRQAGPPGSPGGVTAGRRRVRIQRHGMGHVGAAQHSRRLGDRQQRHLGPGAPPDDGAVRVLGGGRTSARHPLRRSRPCAGWARRAGLHARRAAAGAAPRLRQRPARRGECADRSRRRVSTPVQFGVTDARGVPPCIITGRYR